MISTLCECHLARGMEDGVGWGTSVGWNTRWRQVFAVMYIVIKEIMFICLFLQMDCISLSQMSLHRVKLTLICSPIPLSHSIALIAGDIYQCYAAMGTAAWSGVPGHQMGMDCCPQTNTASPLLQGSCPRACRRSALGKTNTGHCLPMGHLPSYADVRTRLKKKICMVSLEERFIYLFKNKYHLCTWTGRFHLRKSIFSNRKASN